MEQIVQQYLSHLRLQKEKPSINYLQRLIQHQLTFIPYETFSKFHYYSLAPDYIPPLPLFVHHLQTKGWGGTCFTLNINFARLLSELDFECSLVRVEPGHIAIIVYLNQKKYYVDVGYGSPIMKPIELEAKQKHVLHGFGEEIIFRQLDTDTFEIDRRSNGKSFVKKIIIWKPLDESEINQDIRYSYEDCDDNVTMRRITAVRFNGHQCYYLRNKSIKIMTFRNISEVQLSDRTKWTKVIREIYQIDQESILDSLDFLEKRGLNLF